MSIPALLLAIAVAGAATLASRALPFIALRRHAAHPLLRFLGQQLPAVIMTILVCYALRDLRPLDGNSHWNLDANGLPLILASLAVAALHLWRRNVLLSITLGTGFYMVMVQTLGG